MKSFQKGILSLRYLKKLFFEDADHYLSLHNSFNEMRLAFQYNTFFFPPTSVLLCFLRTKRGEVGAENRKLKQ